EVLKETLKIINELAKKETVVTGIPSGFYDLDRLTTGFHPGDLVIIAARPGMGKTSFALSILHHLSVLENIPSAFFSLEMSKEQIAMRLLGEETRIPLKKIRSGFLNESEIEKITLSSLKMMKAPLFIDDTASLSILDLKAKARRLKKEKDIKIIVIDYLQLLRSHRRVENRQQEVAEISRGLKSLAKELSIPVIALAQLSRQAEMRADKRPQLADLRESGCLTGDTLIIDADTGKRIPIKDLVGKTFNTYALDKDYKIKKFHVSKVFPSGIKSIYLLKTYSGKEIKASANHPFLTVDGWVRLDQLKIGDYIATVLANSDIYWDKIVEIKYIGEEEVYDMTVPEVHNFVANDIIVHNSIEQDADLVLFIHRPEYYKKNPSPQEEGLAEIIIAKQRNGPTGTVNLAFIKEITKFENLAKTSDNNIEEELNENYQEIEEYDEGVDF
ncbi:replicative DNA helicase, partial [Sulfurihydrogenibium sp.]|uniref:replicative DNA helicase n=1 Tax=Sulfurihydrogenibium sp. TaxID=2053621 RepID=UPI0026387C68